MVYSDPLAGFYFPIFRKEVLEFSIRHKVLGLPAHLHEVILSFLFYNTIFTLSRLISPLLFKKYHTLTPRNQVNFDIHVVSQIQTFVIVALAIPLFGDQTLAADHVRSYTPYGGFVVAMAAGYFLWDVYVCIRFYKLFGFGFLVHGLGSLFVFSQGLRPYLMYYTPAFLMFELSTPFVNMHWFGGHTPAGTIPEWFQKVNGALLLLVFPSCRIIWGWYQAFFLVQDAWAARADYPTWLFIVTVGSNLSLDVLNVIWFSKMIRTLRRRLKKVSEPTDSLIDKKAKKTQ